MSIKNGDIVSVHYVGTFEDGEEFDRSSENKPLSFTVGAGQMITGFDKSVVGKNVGDVYSISLPPSEAYGEYDEELVFEVGKEDFPTDITPEVGMAFHIQTEQGDIEAVIVQVNEDSLVFDSNFPMAGETLNFEITIAEVKAK